MAMFENRDGFERPLACRRPTGKGAIRVCCRPGPGAKGQVSRKLFSLTWPALRRSPRITARPAARYSAGAGEVGKDRHGAFHLGVREVAAATARGHGVLPAMAEGGKAIMAERRQAGSPGRGVAVLAHPPRRRRGRRRGGLVDLLAGAGSRRDGVAWISTRATAGSAWRGVLHRPCPSRHSRPASAGLNQGDGHCEAGGPQGAWVRRALILGRWRKQGLKRELLG